MTLVRAGRAGRPPALLLALLFAWIAPPTRVRAAPARTPAELLASLPEPARVLLSDPDATTRDDVVFRAWVARESLKELPEETRRVASCALDKHLDPDKKIDAERALALCTDQRRLAALTERHGPTAHFGLGFLQGPGNLGYNFALETGLLVTNRVVGLRLMAMAGNNGWGLGNSKLLVETIKSSNRLADSSYVGELLNLVGGIGTYAGATLGLQFGDRIGLVGSYLYAFPIAVGSAWHYVGLGLEILTSRTGRESGALRFEYRQPLDARFGSLFLSYALDWWFPRP